MKGRCSYRKNEKIGEREKAEKEEDNEQTKQTKNVVT